MLALKSCCENCNKPLPAHAKDARICSFECTFCRSCVENVLQSVCPNCGGDFQPRPIRPSVNFKNNNFIGQHPPAYESIYEPVDLVEHQKLVEKVGAIIER